MPSPSVALLLTQTDERLTALAAAGHERAFEAIVERYRRPLLRHCRRFLPEARAEDALQQALVSAWGALRRGDEVRELRPWLYRIAHNTSLNALRAAGYDYEQLRETLRGGGGPAELAERSAVVRQTLAGLAALPERQREALLRIAVDGRTQDEVAEQLGLSHGAVRQLVHRARTTLRAAATAVVPLPLAGWLAAGADGRGDLVARVGELVAGAGGSATLAKAGAVAVLAGGAVGGPALLDQRQGGAARLPAVTAPAGGHDRDRGKADRGLGDGPAAPATPARPQDDHRPPLAVPPGFGPGGDEDESGRGGAGERPGPGSGDGEDRSGRRSDEGGDDRSGPSRDAGERDSGSSHEDPDDRESPDSGSASEQDPLATPEPEEVSESGSGSGSSGSGSGDSGESGGTSGSDGGSDD
jgi:RNA polymerase sigma factor (sigma-70 family)